MSPSQASKTPLIVWSSTIGNKPRSRAYPSNRDRFVAGAAIGLMSAQKPRFRETVDCGLGATNEAIAEGPRGQWGQRGRALWAAAEYSRP